MDQGSSVKLAGYWRRSFFIGLDFVLVNKMPDLLQVDLS